MPLTLKTDGEVVDDKNVSPQPMSDNLINLRRNLHSFPYVGNASQINNGNIENRIKQNSGSTIGGPSEDGSIGGASSDYGISSSTENSPPNSPSLVPKNQRDLFLSAREYRPLIERMKKMIKNNEPFFSMEFFPPKTANGVANLLSRLERLGEGGPLFVDITWHLASDPGSTKETSSSTIAGMCLNYCRLETMLHITCAQYDVETSKRHLERVKSLGIRNILALRGDLPEDEEKPNDQVYAEKMKYAIDLVRLIRQEYGDYFVICVAGYPTGHPDAPSYEYDLLALKAKVDAGADFIITQLFFVEEQFYKFVNDCRRIGIDVPIIPGLMPIQSYDSLRHIVKLSKLEVPKFILDAVEPIKQNDEAIRNYGISLGVQMCRNLLKSGLAPGLHFYTLNREVATREILQQIGLWKKENIRVLPWKPHIGHHKRCREDVRPIFWSCRPKSYIYRTKEWDDFPNGRWGNSSSPAFGDLKDYYLFLREKPPNEQLLVMWGRELNDEKDVWKVFQNYITGQRNANSVAVTRLPWNEEDMASETLLVRDQLAWCNENGILTINSQPNVNGAPSTDPIVGWGSPGGYVYQKAYLEFFISQPGLNALKRVLPKYPSVHFHIINHNGTVDLTNSTGTGPIAVTWGVFPGCEISQPTVVDPISFHVWKDEAFDAWISNWARLYQDGSTSRNILQGIHDTYSLVTLVDNDYLKACCLWDLLQDVIELRDTQECRSDNVVNFDKTWSCNVNRMAEKKELVCRSVSSDGENRNTSG